MKWPVISFSFNRITDNTLHLQFVHIDLEMQKTKQTVFLCLFIWPILWLSIWDRLQILLNVKQI